MSSRTSRSALRGALLGSLVAIAAAAHAGAEEPAAVQRQLDAQSELIRKQEESLERQRQMLEAQSRQMAEMADRLRRVEDEASATKLAPVAAAGPSTPDPGVAADDNSDPWGSWVGGRGFMLADTQFGSLDISAYALVRYVNQLPPHPDFVNHLGVKKEIDTRNDIYFHRSLIWLRGWMYSEKMKYNLTLWTVNPIHGTGDAIALIGSLGYEFNERFNLYAGVNGNPGVRSLHGSHPYWLGFDRMMGEEFFRPGFTQGIWANGELADRVYYTLMVGNNISTIGISAQQISRDLAYSGSLTWMPTTDEFGPRGGSGDFEDHQQLATRFGVFFTHARDSRGNQSNISSPESTQIRISDSTLLFETGSLAPGVTVEKADYDMVSMDAGVKYKGFFLQGELYYRRLSEFNVSGGPTPMSDIEDYGFQVQTAYMLVPKKLESYLFTSYIFGEFNDPWEVGGGFNYFPFETRDVRINLHTIFVDRSAASSSFGYYVGGLRGPIVSIGTGLMF
jgi:hypothetical protein